MSGSQDRKVCPVLNILLCCAETARVAIQSPRSSVATASIQFDDIRRLIKLLGKSCRGVITASNLP